MFNTQLKASQILLIDLSSGDAVFPDVSFHIYIYTEITNSQRSRNENTHFWWWTKSDKES